LFVGKLNYYKLPGGGIDPGENREQALIREVLEEVGATISVDGEVGETLEYRSKYDCARDLMLYRQNLTKARRSLCLMSG